MKTQKKLLAMLKATASHVTARKCVSIEASTPYALAAVLMEPTVTEERTVAKIDAAMTAAVLKPEMMYVTQEAALEHMAKIPRKSSSAVAIKAMMYTTCVHFDTAVKVFKACLTSLGRVALTPVAEARVSMEVVLREVAAQLNFALVHVVFLSVTAQ